MRGEHGFAPVKHCRLSNMIMLASDKATTLFPLEIVWAISTDEVNIWVNAGKE